MALIDIISNISEFSLVSVFCNGLLVSAYNGKDAIDESLNNRQVVSVISCDNEYSINIR